MAPVLMLLAATAGVTDPVQTTPPPTERTSANVEAASSSPVDPLTLEVAYAGDLLSSVRGGRRRGTRHIDNLDVIGNADLDALADIPRTKAALHVFYNNGARFSGNVVGDAQVASGIEAGTRMFRVADAWIEHRGVDDRWSVKLGIYDINSEFDALDAALLFIHSAFGMGTDLGQSGANGPSTFPNSSFGVRGQVMLGPRLTLRAAVMDGQPNDPLRPTRMVFRFGKQEGALLIAEADVELGNARLIAGAWGYTAPSEHRFDAAIAAPTIREARSKGAYLRGEAQITGNAERGLSGFARIGVADGRTNLFGGFVSGGLTWRGLVPGRPADETGIAFAYASSGSAARRISRATYGRAEDGELAIELTHRVKLTDWLSLQPDVQYIVDPGLDPQVRDALVIGGRLAIGIPL
jgi:porin